MYVCGRKCAFPLVQMKVCMFDTISTCLNKVRNHFCEYGCKAERKQRYTEGNLICKNKHNFYNEIICESTIFKMQF